MWAKRLLAHSEPQLQSHKVLTRALIEGCHLGMPTGQATSDRALATLNKFCRQGAIGRGGSGLWPSFQRGMQEHERSGVMRRREQLTTLRGTGRNTNRCSRLTDFRELSFVR